MSAPAPPRYPTFRGTVSVEGELIDIFFGTVVMLPLDLGRSLLDTLKANGYSPPDEECIPVLISGDVIFMFGAIVFTEETGKELRIRQTAIHVPITTMCFASGEKLGDVKFMSPDDYSRCTGFMKDIKGDVFLSAVRSS